MIYDLPDVDLDVAHRDAAIAALKGFVLASNLNTDQLTPHPTGLYLQQVPADPVTGLAAFPYDVAEAFGYYKIDVLTNSVYVGIDHEDHLLDLLDEPTDWNWFQDVDFTRSLFHFGGMVEAGLSMAEVVASYRPQSVDDLACLMAIKLPAKKYLIGEKWPKVRECIWLKEPSGKPQFKKSHAVSYALAVTVDAKLKAPDWFGPRT